MYSLTDVVGGGPRRSARFRYPARGGQMTSVCCAIIPLTRKYSSIGRQRVRHTALRPLIHLTGPARPHDEKPSRRRRLSELLQWQLLMRGAPHIWELRASCSLVPSSSLLSSRLACEARPSAKYPPARAVNNKHRLRSVSLALSIGCLPIGLQHHR